MDRDTYVRMAKEFGFGLKDYHLLKLNMNESEILQWDREVERTTLLSKVQVAKLAYEQNPHDVKNLKNWASLYVGLAFVFPHERQDIVMHYLRVAKSKLELALSIKEDYYEAMFDLGILHYKMLYEDRSLEVFGDTFWKHCRRATELFKKVKEKAPDVYVEDMLELVRRHLPSKHKGCPTSWVLPAESFDSSEDSSEDDDDEGDETTSSYKQKMIGELLDVVFEKLALDPGDTVSKFRLTKAFQRLPIRDPNGSEKVHEEGNQLHAQEVEN